MTGPTCDPQTPPCLFIGKNHKFHLTPEREVSQTTKTHGYTGLTVDSSGASQEGK